MQDVPLLLNAHAGRCSRTILTKKMVRGERSRLRETSFGRNSLPQQSVEAEHDRCDKDLGNQFSRVPFAVRNELVDRFHSQFQIGTGNASFNSDPESGGQACLHSTL
jgi:hypothetical protein